MSSWYVFNAIGLYPFSPANVDYIISVPLFKEINFNFDNNLKFTIEKKNTGQKIINIIYGNQKILNYFISYDELKKGKVLVITTK